MQKVLTHSTEIEVKFSEADSLSIVWHGHYIRYFEDGREAFGKVYGLSYLDVFNEGFVIPIVNVQCDYKRPLKYGDTARIETTYHSCDAAKLKFSYRLFNAATGDLIATGHSIQVFLERNNSVLQLSNPPFFEAWKKKQGVI